MTELQVLFLIVGIVLFAVIALVSMWQLDRNGRSMWPFSEPRRERKSRSIDEGKKAAQAGDEKASPGRRVRRMMGSKKEASPAPQQIAPVRIHPIQDEPGLVPKTQSRAFAEEEGIATPDQSADPQIDSAPLRVPLGAGSQEGIVVELVARIKNKAPVEQQKLLALLREFDYRFHRNVRLYGLNLLTARWCDVEHELPSAQFVDLGLSIQLADRNGGMSNKESHDFQQMVLAFADAYDSAFDFSMDLDQAMEQAKCLDQISARFDVIATIHVIPRSQRGFRRADVESCARDLVMSPDKEGVFLKSTGGNKSVSVLYRLACMPKSKPSNDSVPLEAAEELALFMNVASTPNPEQVFEMMADDANRLATWLEGKVADRNGRVLTQKALATMMHRVSQINQELSALGIAPGDSVSRKLF